MSVWKDIREKSLGKEVKKQNMISGKGQLAETLKKKLEEGNLDLSSVVESWIRTPKAIDADQLNEELITIEDSDSRLSQEEMLLLKASTVLPFQLGIYGSLDDLLSRLNVKVVIVPGVHVRKTVPIRLIESEQYWKNVIARLSGQQPSDHILNELQDARYMLEEILKEKELWLGMPLRGEYTYRDVTSGTKMIKLYPDEMRKENDGKNVPELLVSTLAHEAMHAYFDRPSHEDFEDSSCVEEPFAEFGMLLFLSETKMTRYFGWAYDDVSSQKTCYRYGRALMDQCIREGKESQTRKDLVSYRIPLF